MKLVKTCITLVHCSTVPPSCFQRTNSNHSDVTMNDSYQVMLEIGLPTVLYFKGQSFN